MAKINMNRDDVETDLDGCVSFSSSKDATNKLFMMLSDYLYSDKEYAVISEISSNAVDAHAMVGKQAVPIKVRMPNAIDENFTVRDFGPGLSEDNVYKFLTQYGESSKGEDITQIGAWGIGSKSPAAVTDTWSIISYHNGLKTHYEVFISAAGTPTLKKIFQSLTNESGLEVSIPVPGKNTQKWKEAAVKAYHYYEVMPDINIQLASKEEPVIQGNDWCAYNKAVLQFVAVTTLRGYNIDFSKLDFDPTEKLSALFYSKYAYRHLSFVMNFGIGELDLSISREQVQYTPRTIAAIKKRILEIDKEISSRIVKSLSQVEDKIEYRQVLRHWYDMLNSPSEFLTALCAGNKHGVMSIPKDIQKITIPWNSEEHDFTLVCDKLVKRPSKTRYGMAFGGIEQSEAWNNTTKTYEKYLSIDLSVLKDVIVVIRDAGEHIARVLHSGERTKRYIIVKENFFPDYIPVVKVSSFAKSPRNTKEVEEKIDDFYQFDGNRVLKMTRPVVDWCHANPDKTVIVPLEGYKSAADTKELMDNARGVLEKNGYKFFGCKPGTVHKYQDMKTAVKKFYDENYNTENFISAYCNSIVRVELSGQSKAIHSTFALLKFGVKSKRFNDFVAPLSDLYKKYLLLGYFDLPQSKLIALQVNEYKSVAKYLGLETFKPDWSPADFFYELYKRYPLLKWCVIDTHSDSGLVKPAVEYVDLIDSK